MPQAALGRLQPVPNYQTIVDDLVSMPQAALGRLQLDDMVRHLLKESFDAASGIRSVATLWVWTLVIASSSFDAASGIRSVATKGTAPPDYHRWFRCRKRH